MKLSLLPAPSENSPWPLASALCSWTTLGFPVWAHTYWPGPEGLPFPGAICCTAPGGTLPSEVLCVQETRGARNPGHPIPSQPLCFGRPPSTTAHSSSLASSMLLSLVHFGTWTLTILLIWVGGGGTQGEYTCPRGSDGVPSLWKSPPRPGRWAGNLALAFQVCSWDQWQHSPQQPVRNADSRPAATALPPLPLS